MTESQHDSNKLVQMASTVVLDRHGRLKQFYKVGSITPFLRISDHGCATPNQEGACGWAGSTTTVPSNMVMGSCSPPHRGV